MKAVLSNIYYSFPVQLLINNIKKNHILLLCWVLLFLIITGNFGVSLGIPYLFLDPEYLNSVNFVSFLIMGVALAGFTISFHITSYIIDGYRFRFLGQLPKPFSKFSINNSIIPFVFLVLYIYQVANFQYTNEYAGAFGIATNISGLLVGYIAMIVILYIYFRSTNKDIFKYVVCKVDENLKQKIKVTRSNALAKLNAAKKRQIRVDNYLSLNLRSSNVPDDHGFYDKATILQVFDQNHLNLVIIELLVFLSLMVIGIFKDYPFFQIPAAASVLLFLTIFVMFAGAFTYWFRGWSFTVVVALFVVLNYVVKEDFIGKHYQAFGLNYQVEAANYSLSNLNKLSSEHYYEQDRLASTQILENWKSKFPEEKPKMVFICSSGGGQRASLWTMQALQKADSATGGKLIKNTMLMTGASGGLIGASYFRELYFQSQQGLAVDLYDKQHLDNISSDNLNPIIFSLLVNDLFVNFSKFSYAGLRYPKDRGYSFEEQLNKNTGQVLAKSISDYRQPELESKIPMIILAPTIINDGRKLFISPHNVSYMSVGAGSNNHNFDVEIEGIDFLRFFENQGSEDLRFLSALRMSATFPWVTPNVTLPSSPPMQIMDAGITDNFGISDAIRFMYAFREWIDENTSGVIILSIRDSLKDGPINRNQRLSLVEKFSNPISSIYLNFENLQDINNDVKIQFAQSWLEQKIHRIDLQYVPQTNPNKKRERASLNWRLTSKEKDNILKSIDSNTNQVAIRRLVNLLGN